MPCSCRFEWHGADATVLTICTRDRTGLFADAAGTLTCHGVEILSAELNTREDGVAIDVLVLRNAATHKGIDEHRWPVIERALREAITGSVDVGELVERWRKKSAPRRSARRPFPARATSLRVMCDNEVATSATVVEVRAPDEPGLAYKIASALTGLNLNIAFARITTDKSDAFDVFYVTDFRGDKLSDDSLRAVEATLTERLAAGNV